MKRKLINGTRLKELKKATHIGIGTRVPKKWLFVDCEVGTIWSWSTKHERFKAATPTQIAMIRQILEEEEY